MNIAEFAKTRHSCKAFDSEKKIAPELVQQLEDVLRFAPSSINSQPWHHVLASTQAGKEKIAQSMPGVLEYNASKVKAASHVVVLCCLNDLPNTHIEAMVEQEGADGRYAKPEEKEKRLSVCTNYVGMHRQADDMQAWMGKQVYLALGSLLLAAATLGVDACPIEGFDAKLLDAALDLPAQKLHSLVVVALGYRSEADFNAELPKSRFDAEAVFTRI